jgi:hypothetical protein
MMWRVRWGGTVRRTALFGSCCNPPPRRALACFAGKDYPLPIVDHDKTRKENLDKMAAAYGAAMAAKTVVLMARDRLLSSSRI